MTFIQINDQESFDQALRRFRKQNQYERLKRELSKHMVYEKPSKRRKRKEAEARKRLQKRLHQRRQRMQRNP